MTKAGEKEGAAGKRRRLAGSREGGSSGNTSCRKGKCNHSRKRKMATKGREEDEKKRGKDFFMRTRRRER